MFGLSHVAYSRPRKEDKCKIKNFCMLFDCGIKQQNRCCCDCPETECEFRCLNSPERCGYATRNNKL